MRKLQGVVVWVAMPTCLYCSVKFTASRQAAAVSLFRSNHPQSLVYRYTGNEDEKSEAGGFIVVWSYYCAIQYIEASSYNINICGIIKRSVQSDTRAEVADRRTVHINLVPFSPTDD